MARIPAEIWRFCVEQVKLYPLYEAQYFEELKNAETMYLHSDGDKTIDPTKAGGKASSPISPIEIRYQAMESYIEQPYIKYLAKCVARMKDVMRGLEPDELEVLRAVWEIGWRDNEALARQVSTSKTTVARNKRTIVKRLAVRWGLWQ